MHGSRPLPVACIQILLPVPGRRPEIRLQHRVAAIRQPLGVWIVPPHVTPPRAAMRKHDHGQVLRLRTCWCRQVAIDQHPIARLVFNRFYFCELVLFQIRAVAEQHGCLLGGPVVQVVIDRRVVAFESHHPPVVCQITTDVADIRIPHFLQRVIVGLQSRVEDLEIPALAQKHHGLQFVCLGLGHDKRDIELRIFREHRPLAGSNVY